MADKVTNLFLSIVKSDLGCKIATAHEIAYFAESKEVKEKRITYGFPVQELKNIHAVVDEYLEPAVSKLKNQIVYDVFQGQHIFPVVSFKREYDIKTDEEIHIIGYFTK